MRQYRPTRGEVIFQVTVMFSGIFILFCVMIYGCSKNARAIFTGELVFGGVVVDCAVLEDGTRLLSQRGISKALGGSNPTSMTRRGAGKLPSFLSSKSIKPFVTRALEASANPVPYIPPHVGRIETMTP